MPIVPPDPGKILDTLRAALAELQALAATQPANVHAIIALSHTAAAVAAVEILNPNPPDPHRA